MKSSGMKCERSIKHPYIILSAAVLITSAVLYCGFIFGPYILAYKDIGYDTYHQYYPVYKFFAQLFQNGYVPEYSFAYGVGTSIFTPISWIVDPFSALNSLIGAVWGTDCIGSVLVYTQILKLLCAGLLCLYFLKLRGYSDRSSIISSYIFSFSGFMMTSGQHYFFAAFPIYLLLLLIYVEKTLKDSRKVVVLTIVSLLVGIRGPYAAYMIYLAAAFYTFSRAFEYGSYKFGRAAGKIVYAGVAMVWGLLLSMAVFLPQLTEITSSSRLAGSSGIVDKIISSFALTDFRTICSQILRIFSNSLEGAVNEWKGAQFHWEMFACFFSVLFVPAAAQYLYAAFKGGKPKRVIVWRFFEAAFFVFIIICNFVPSLFNLFEYPVYRYTFVLLPCFALVVADVLDEIWEKGVFSSWINCAVTAISAAIVGVLGYRAYCQEITVRLPLIWTLVSLIASAAFLDLLHALRKKDLRRGGAACGKTRAAFAVLAAVLVLNMLLENGYTLYYNRVIATKESAIAENMDPDYVKAVELAQKAEGDNFYRIETTIGMNGYPDAMYSVVTPARTLSYYNTVAQTSIQDYMVNINADQQPLLGLYNQYEYGTQMDRVISDILGLKYIVAIDRDESTDWSLVDTFGVRQLFVNNALGSAGLVYDRYITEEEAKQLSINEQRALLAGAVILDCEDIPEGFAQPYEGSAKTDITDAIMIAETASLDAMVENSGVLSDGSISLSARSSSSQFQLFIPLDKTLFDVQEQQNILRIKTGEGSMLVSALVKSTSGQYIYTDLRFAVSNGEGYAACTIPKDACELVLTCQMTGDVYEIASMSLSAIPIGYDNAGIRLNNADMNGVVSGTVTADKDCIFYVPIPYEDRWQAKVDGQETEIINANYGFCAVLMPEGEHTVEFIHVNSSVEYGLYISCAAAVLCGAYYAAIFFVNRRRKLRCG